MILVGTSKNLFLIFIIIHTYLMLAQQKCYTTRVITLTLQNCLSCKTSTMVSMLRLPIGGIAPNQVIARSEFEVHRHIYTE